MEDWEETDEKVKQKLGLMACGAVCAINIGIALVAVVVAVLRDPIPPPTATQQVEAGPVDQAVVDAWQGRVPSASEDFNRKPGLLATSGLEQSAE